MSGRVGTLNRSALASVLALPLLACVGPFSENVEHEYANAKAVTAAQQGWIPDILPEDAARIREVHHIDSNRTWGCFTTRDLGAVRAALSTLGARATAGPIHTGPREIFRDFSWWPQSMGSSAIDAFEFREPPPYPAASRGFLIRVGIDAVTGTVCFHRLP
jgi:hypothetical protein